MTDNILVTFLIPVLFYRNPILLPSFFLHFLSVTQYALPLVVSPRMMCRRPSSCRVYIPDLATNTSTAGILTVTKDVTAPQIVSAGSLGLTVGGGVPRPELMVEQSAGSVIISWPDSAGFMLFQTLVLGTGATWTEVGAGTLNGTTRSVTVPLLRGCGPFNGRFCSIGCQTPA